MVYLINKGVYIKYSNLNSSGNIERTGFDIEIKGGICYIHDFSIEKNQKLENYSVLADIIESFCIEEFKCKEFETIPRGLLKMVDFWNKRGFKYKNAIVAGKELK